MTEDEVLRRIREAEETRATELDLGDLYDSGLDAIPADLGRLRSLRRLSLRGWRIPDIGPLTDRLKSLQSLDLSYCGQLSGDLTPLASLTSLQSLDLSYCRQLSRNLTPLASLTSLKSLDLSNCEKLSGNLTPLASLTSLQSLDLSNCWQLSGDLTPLASLTSLQSLDLTSCGLSGDLAPLASLTSLQSLDLSNCGQLSGDLTPLAALTSLQSVNLADCGQLSDLTPLASLTSLQSLDLGGCELPSGNLTPLASLTSLQLLDLSDCEQLSDLTPLISLTSLHSLNLAGCWQITDFRPLNALKETLRSLDLSWCRKGLHFSQIESFSDTLNSLKLHDCHFADLPAEVCGAFGENVIEKVRAHYADLLAGPERDAEVKVLFLGNGGAGKSQLSRRLRGLPFDPTVPSTHGIEVRPSTIELDSFPSPVRLNLWDFGGQEIYHGSHALFLQGQAVFLILWTPELEQAGLYQENGMMFRHRPLSYWLDYLRAFAGVESPVVVIQSQCDLPSQRVRDVPAVTDARRDFTRLETEWVSAKEGRGLDSVRAALKEAVRECIERRPPPPIGVGRVRVRDRVRQLPDEGVRWLERADFDRICEEEKGISDTGALLDFLYQSGVLFYRPGVFGGRVVVDQNWALEAVYALFDRRRVLPLLRNHGRFRRADLATLIWSQYSPEEQAIFLGMMEGCGICFRVQRLADGESEYIAPELLPEWPEAQRTLLTGRLLKTGPTEDVEVPYTFLHEGLLRNFLSKVGQHVGEAGIYWKYGCWFYEETTDSRVLMESRWEDAEAQAGSGSIRFRAWGVKARELVEPLLQELERMPAGQKAQIIRRTSEMPARELISLRPAVRVQPDSGERTVYVSYAWGGDSSAVVDELCGALNDWNIVRDKDAMRYGDLISAFMKTIARGDRIIVVLSEKYLQSPYCMAELYGIYQRSNGEKDEFLRHVIVMALGDAKFATWRDRADAAEYWQREFKEMEKRFSHLGGADLLLYKEMRDWHNRVGDMLAHVNDVLRPIGMEEIMRDDFAALRGMLAERA